MRARWWALASGLLFLAPEAARAADDTAPAGMRKHAVDVVDYQLAAILDADAHAVHGSGTIRWTNTSSKAVRELWLHLYLNAFKNDRSDFLRERVGGRGSAPLERPGGIEMRALALSGTGGVGEDLLTGMEIKRPGSDDETDARVPLPRDVAPGESVQLAIEFDDVLPLIVERTGYRGSFHMVGQWFPKVARLEPDGTWAHFSFHHLAEFYADFGTYDVTLDVPATFTVGATGPLVESRTEHDRRIERHVQADVHDFAWTAWDAWQSRSETIDGVAVLLLYPPGFGAVAARDLAAVRFALPYYSARYGPYPYPTLTVAHPPQDAAEAGGMEYPTLITGDGPWLTPPGILEPEIVAVHELGHQWFYGLIATNEAAWPFLDEGIDQFAEGDVMAKWRGQCSAVDLFGLGVSDAAIQAVGGNQSARDEPVAQAASAFSSAANYARLAYARTASVMETLRRVYGDDAIARTLGSYARRNRFEHPGPDALIEAFGDELGSDVASTLRAALFDKGWVDFAVDEIWSKPAEGASDVYEGAALVRRRGTLVLPVDVELVFSDGTRRRERWDGHGDWRRFQWRGPIALVGAVVDPDDRVVIDANLANNHRSTSAGRGHARRTLERATYLMELLVQALSP